MKVLVISHEYPPIGGGGANACYYLTRNLAEQNINVNIVTANYGNLPPFEEQEGVRIYRVRSKRKYKSHCSFTEMADFLLKAYPLINKLEKTERYDLCQVFFGIPSGPIGYMLKKKYKLPYVIRFGGGDIPGFQERFKWFYKLLAPFIKAIWKNADMLVANSEGLQHMAYSFYEGKKIMIIPNGVDAKFFTPQKKTEKDMFTILFVSRLIERKGLQFILPYLKEIQSKTNKTIKLIIVGDGPFRNKLEQITIECGISHMVSFEGEKNKAELIEYYQNASLFILPSAKEGMPNVVLEAMACGLPIVITPCEGSKELVKTNGYIIDVQGFPEKMLDIINNDIKRIEMSRESRRMIEECYGWGQIGENYRKVYDGILKNKKN